ncbi:MAG: TlpA disulfide reductase family protein [Verrucomicrobiales bacterium]
MRWLFIFLIGFTAYKLLTGSESGAGQVGQPLPAITAQYHAGSAPYMPGRPAIIEFWATWCPPCRQSIPHLNSLYERAGGSLQVVGITQEDEATVHSFRLKTPMKYSVASDPSGSLAQYFGVRGIPTAVLVDAQGMVKWTGHPMELNEGKIKSLLP